MIPVAALALLLLLAACEREALDPIAPDVAFNAQEAPALCRFSEGVTIRGTTIYGTEERDVILCHDSGETRDLRIFGLGGDDTILGGPGDDYLSGGPGCDRILGLDGDDELDGGPGDDIPEAGPGDGCDFNLALGRVGGLWGGNGDDILRGGPGFDRLFGGFGEDDLDGGEGCDNVRGGPDNDRVAGGPGHDLRGPREIYLGGNATIIAGCGDDPDDPNDQLFWGGVRGEGGDDLVLGGPGLDSHVGHGGYDVCDGGPPQRGSEQQFFHETCEEVIQR
jgi:Ca2+-binding RTX toxin-like protein